MFINQKICYLSISFPQTYLYIQYNPNQTPDCFFKVEIDKLILEFMRVKKYFVTHKEQQSCKTSVIRNHIYYKATVINAEYHWHRHRQIDQRAGIRIQEQTDL